MNILELQSCMPKESKGKLGLSTHAGEAVVQGLAQRGELLGTHIGQFARFDIAPHLFDRIEFRSIAGQAFDVQPAALARQVGAHRAARVRAQAIPDQDHTAPAEVPFQLAQKPNEWSGRIGARARLKIEAAPPPIPAEGQGPGHGEPLPGPAGVGQDGGLAAWRPRATDDGLLRDAAFVFEDDPGVLASGVFLPAPSAASSHSSIAPASRSRARRAGRCRDQFKPRRMRHTCPG